MSGVEGNGAVRFVGTYSSISWTMTFENFYGFTVGTAGNLPEVPSLAFGPQILLVLLDRKSVV